MRFPDFYASRPRPVISFEIFPPKTDKAMEQLDRVVPRLVALRPDFMTVTYGALGTTQERTLGIATRLRNDFKIETASHLTCVGASADKIDAILEQLRAANIENIVALRGDPPEGQDEFVAADSSFSHANDLVTHIRQHQHKFGVAVAGYPEKHIEAPELDTDLRHLKGKVDAGADVVVTQLFYDNEGFYRFVDRAREIGIEVPIVAGLLPIQSFTQIKRITALCGSKIPAKLDKALSDVADDADAVKDVGVRWAIDQLNDLLDRGVDGIHFYVLNRSRHMERIFEAVPALGDR